MNYAVLRVILSILSLSPVRSSEDFDFKWDIAEAISNSTDDVRQQDILIRIAYYESNFRRSVAKCSIKGDKGKSLGIFQVQPISKYDSKFACGSVENQVKLALNYIHRSFEACPGNAGADLLSMYVSGTCQRGLKEAKHRWAE